MELSAPRRMRVHQKTWEAEGITSVTFTDPCGAALPAWEPGAHLALRLPNGLVREYSLCSDPSDTTRWTVAVARDPNSRGGSTFVHDSLHVGSEIEIEGPRSAFAIDDDADEHVLVAGGIGITPIVAMARRLEASGRPWRLLYAGRTRDVMAFADELSQHAAVTLHSDDVHGGLPDLEKALSELGASTTVYCCGPGALMDAVAALVPEGRLRTERFKAPEPKAPTGDDSAFDVVLASSGLRVSVPPTVSVLDALADAGVAMASSCTEGICGTCEVGVVSGEVDHRDHLLSESEHAEGNTMFPCVSRCRSTELVLDL